MPDLHPRLEKFLRELLPTMDNLMLAVKAIDADPNTNEAVSEGVRAIHRQLIDLLAKYDVRNFTSTGTPFDPARHEAMAQIHSDEHPPNHVAREIRTEPGLSFTGRLGCLASSALLLNIDAGE